MRFLSVAHTDTGTTKKVNQDAFCLKVAKVPTTLVAFAAICDGMGGLKNGELASALLINAFSAWFENELPVLFEKPINLNDVQLRWNQIANEQNLKISKYGQNNGFSLGTTLSAILIINDKYLFIQVGDSRIYRLNTSISQITKDQTVVAKEVENKRLTVEQAKTDTRKNVLLQCVGASKTLIPEFGKGNINENDVFLLCSDGFSHEISDDELFGVLSSNLLTSEKVMKKCLVDLIELNKTRKEKDNITAILMKAIK